MITAVTMARDEADVIGLTVRHLYEQGVDLVIVSDNLSNDGTPDLARDAGATVTIDPDPGYWQARKMTALAEYARSQGATWVLPFDADEIWYSGRFPTIADELAAAEYDVLIATGWDHIARRDCKGNPFHEMTFRRPTTQRFPKVAFRAHPEARLHMGNHDVDHPGTRGPGLHYRHFQYRSFEQYARKVRQGTKAYEATDLDRSYGAHWRRDAALDDESLMDKWRDLCATEGLVEDPAPCQ